MYDKAQVHDRHVIGKQVTRRKLEAKQGVTGEGEGIRKGIVWKGGVRNGLEGVT